MYEPSKHVATFHIAGFQHYDGALLFGKLKPGRRLKMVPEPDNPYDPDAIELRFKKTKLGYVPRSENGLFAAMAHYGHKDVFEARMDDCVLAAVNLGSDADTTACVAGALAGAVYGYRTIPAEWLGALRGKDVIERCLFPGFEKVRRWPQG